MRSVRLPPVSHRGIATVANGEGNPRVNTPSVQAPSLVGPTLPRSKPILGPCLLVNHPVNKYTSASLAIHAVGRGLAQAIGTLAKHGVKQVDRLLSNRGVDVWVFFAYWTPFIVGARTEVVVALDLDDAFAADGQDTIVLSMVTGHGRATPLLWKTVASSTLKGNQRR